MSQPRIEPLVSVLMASYNAEAYIGEAIESVLGQTYRTLELIVVDDRSDDATPDIADRYARREPDRVRLVRKDRREGPCRARNDALALARGSLFCWIDNDDLWLPSKVEEQVTVMEARPDVGLVYTYFEAFDSETGAILPWSDGRRDFEGDVLAPLLVIGCFIGSLTTMFRREALETRGLRLRDRDFSFGDDYDLWLTIALDWHVARIPRVLARYRRHPANESARLSEANVDLMRIRLLEEFLAAHPEAGRRLGYRRRIGFGRHYLLAARHEARCGRSRRALELRLRALAHDPLALVRPRLGAVRRRLRRA